MTPIDVLASEAHFVDHVAPVFAALPAELRGRAIARHDDPRYRAAAAARFASYGFEPGSDVAGDSPILVAGIGDLRRARHFGRQHVALMEHGAGQSYGGDPSKMAARHPSYAGGERRDADLFLHPGPHPAGRDRDSYPNARIEIVGSPFLDTMPARAGASTRPVVAVTTHFDAPMIQEAESGFAWLSPAIAAMARHGRVEVLGHGHPRTIERLARWYERNGIEIVRDFRDVLRRADLLVFDNTSAGFAFAASGRPVVVANPPRYRRGVEHGLRFWEAASVGVQVDRPGELEAAVERALALEVADVVARELALDLVYAHRAGAAGRAADALARWSADVSDRRLEAVA